jgi:hypothetical protein
MAAAAAMVAPRWGSTAAKVRRESEREARGYHCTSYSRQRQRVEAAPWWPAFGGGGDGGGGARRSGRRRGLLWRRLRSSEAGQGPLYSRGKAVGRGARRWRVGAGRRAARGALMAFGVATRRRRRRGRSQDEVTARAGVRGAGDAVLDGGRRASSGACSTWVQCTHRRPAAMAA